jgi:hypothetical protein
MYFIQYKHVGGVYCGGRRGEGSSSKVLVAVIYCKWIKSEITARRRGRRPEIVAVRWIP